MALDRVTGHIPSHVERVASCFFLDTTRVDLSMSHLFWAHMKDTVTQVQGRGVSDMWKTYGEKNTDSVVVVAHILGINRNIGVREIIRAAYMSSHYDYFSTPWRLYTARLDDKVGTHLRQQQDQHKSEVIYKLEWCKRPRVVPRKNMKSEILKILKLSPFS